MHCYGQELGSGAVSRPTTLFVQAASSIWTRRALRAACPATFALVDAWQLW